MKNLVKLISIVMLMAMCLSLMSVGAFADDSVVIIGGENGSSGSQPSSGNSDGYMFSYGGSSEDPFASSSSGNGSGSAGSASGGTATINVDKGRTTSIELPDYNKVEIDGFVADSVDFSAYDKNDLNVFYNGTNEWAKTNQQYLKWFISRLANDSEGKFRDSDDFQSGSNVFATAINFAVNQYNKAANEKNNLVRCAAFAASEYDALVSAKTETTETPATDAPATEAPATEAPATEAPATDAPAAVAPEGETPAITAEPLSSVSTVDEYSYIKEYIVKKLGSEYADLTNAQIDELMGSKLYPLISGISNGSLKLRAKEKTTTPILNYTSVTVASATTFNETDLANAITKAGNGGSIAFNGTAVLNNSSDLAVIINFNPWNTGSGATLVGSGANAVLSVEKGLYEFKNGTIKGAGIIVGANAKVILENMKIYTQGEGNAILVNGGSVDIERSCDISTANNQPAVYVKAASSDVNFSGRITSTGSQGVGLYIEAGKVTMNPGDLNGGTNNWADINASTGVIVRSGSFLYNGGTINGTGLPGTTGDTKYGGAAIAYKDGVTISINTGKIGNISSFSNKAIYFDDGDVAHPLDTPVFAPTAKVAVVDYSIIHDAKGCVSDVGTSASTTAVAEVSGIVYNTLDEAITAAAADGAPSNIVKLLKDINTGATINLTIPAGKSVVINGDGHTIKNTGAATTVNIPVGNGNLKIKNLNILGNDLGVPAVTIQGGVVEMTDVTVNHCKGAAIQISNAEATLYNFQALDPSAGTIGIDALAGSKVSVYDMTTKSVMPVKKAAGADVSIYQATCYTDAANTSDPNLSGTISSLGGGSSYALDTAGKVLKINAKEVGFNVTAGLDNGLLRYIKGTNQVIQFSLSNPLADGTITAVADDGTEYILTTTSKDGGKTVTPTVESLEKLPAGRYTLQLKFKDGGMATASMYVNPGKANETNSPAKNYLKLTGYDSNKGIEYYDAIQKAKADSKGNGLYTIASDEAPKRFGIGTANAIIWLSDECVSSNGTTTSVVLLRDDLDHLSNGTNYVWLDYGSYYDNVPFEVRNAQATISPTSTSWSKADGNKVFTVWPDVQTVRINGYTLKSDSDHPEYSYKDGKLTIFANFLRTLANGDYKVEVSTTKGGVGADLHIGESLRAKTPVDSNGVGYHVYGGNKPITFTSSSAIDYTKGIWIGKANPIKIDDQYIVDKTATSFTLSSAYLNKLSTLGTYYISAFIGDQSEYCTTTFKIISASQAAFSPATGDNSNLLMWAIILVLSAVIIAVILVPRLKKGSSDAAASVEDAVKEKLSEAEADISDIADKKE